MGNKEQIEKIILERNKSVEKIFPIMNKIDRIFTTNPELQFCELVKLLEIDKYKTDLELTKHLDDYIDKNGIK